MKQVAISSATDILNALDSEHLDIKAAILKAIAAHPEQAQTVCSRDEIDLFDQLRFRVERTEDTSQRAALLAALLRFDDQRRIAVAQREFARSRDARLILITGQQLAQLPESARVCILAPMLMRSRERTQCRAAANLLAGTTAPDTHCALRIALLSDHQIPIPNFEESTSSAWIAELGGPFAITARQAFQTQLPGKVMAVLKYWEELDDQTRRWALHIVRDSGQIPCHHMLVRMLAGAQQATLLQILRALQQRIPAESESLLEPLYTHTDHRVRAAAIDAGTAPLPWSDMLHNQVSEEVRSALIKRLSDAADLHTRLHIAADALADDHWRVRAAATQVLVDCGSAAVNILTEHLDHPREALRAAAIKGLLELGEHNRVQDFLNMGNTTEPDANI